MTSLRPPGDTEWDYVRPAENVKPFLRFEEQSPGIFELICLDGWPSKVASNRPDGSYATKDLFLKHQTIEAYKYYARLDDTIVLVNGEKVNPLDMEGSVRQHDTVSEAVVFGSGRPSIGLIIIRADESDISDDEVIHAVWRSVEKAQEAMPAFGRLSKNMVRVLPANTTYPRTDKGTVIRQAFYRNFAELIEATYRAEDTATGSLRLSETELRAFIGEQLQRILPLKSQSVHTEDADFFGLGMDSLQATQLRSVLAKSLNTNGHRLGLNVAFEHPSISLLARYIYSLGSGAVDGPDSVEEQMKALIAKYSQFEPHVPSPNGRRGRYIVCTPSNQVLPSTDHQGYDRCNRFTRKPCCGEAVNLGGCTKGILSCARRVSGRSVESRARVHAHTTCLRFTRRSVSKQAHCSPIRPFRTQSRPHVYNLQFPSLGSHRHHPLRLVCQF